MYTCGVQSLTDINEVDQKLQKLLSKLQTAYGKSNFKLFTEKHERLKLETFPKKANEVKNFLDYELLANNCNQNISSKETAAKIGYLTRVNQETVYHLGYQDNVNNLLDSSFEELNEEGQEDYLMTYRTNSEDAIYN
eukprot:2020079-Ditylum_brightwellii.AAC.1